MPDSYDYSQPQRKPNPIANTPFVTYILVATCILATLAYTAAIHSPNSPSGKTVLGYALWPDEVWSGRYWQLFTTVFIHEAVDISPWHLLFDAYMLYRLGCVLELTLGPAVFFLLFFLTSVVASGAELAWGNGGIGASGAVYGLFGVMWAGKGRYRSWQDLATGQTMNYLIGWGLLCILTTWTGWMPVANAAHFGGLLFGLSVGWVFFAPRRRPIWIAPLVGMILLTVLSVFWQPWSAGWYLWRGNREYLAGRFPQAIDCYKRGLKILRWRPNSEMEKDEWTNIARAWSIIAEDAAKRGNLDEGERALKEAQEAMGHIGLSATRDENPSAAPTASDGASSGSSPDSSR